MTQGHNAQRIDTADAWWRLAAAVLLMTLGGAGMYGVTVALPVMQADFGVSRADASLPYTATMVGFTLGGLLAGRLTDRFGVMRPVMIGAICLFAGLLLASQAQSLWQLVVVQGLVIGFFGTSSTFAPLIADISHWFIRYRGLAVAICASGNYLSGTVWPPLIEYWMRMYGWRTAYQFTALICLFCMLPLAWCLRRAAPIGLQPQHAQSPTQIHVVSTSSNDARPLDLSPRTLQWILLFAGLTCCIAMSMPQVHIVAYCSDLGFATARGAEMLALMLGAGIISRMASGWIADRIGALKTLLVGSALQTIALALFLPFESLTALYVASGLFGLFQGGIVPMYALIVRDYFPASEAGRRVSMVLTATVFGMAIGGWMSGVVFDLSGSYTAAFINGIFWNCIHLALTAELLRRARQIALRNTHSPAAMA